MGFTRPCQGVAVPRAAATLASGLPTAPGGREAPGLCRTHALWLPQRVTPSEAAGGNGVAHHWLLTSARSPAAKCHSRSRVGTLGTGSLRDIPGGPSSSWGNTWLLFLAIHHMQPKMKEKTIAVPSTDGGRAPNDAVNVPSEEVSPNPQQICPVSP